MPDDWVYDQKGWTVFIQEGETATELTPDGIGGFSGLSETGQSFYFSRTIKEELDSPTLLLNGANHTFQSFWMGRWSTRTAQSWTTASAIYSFPSWSGTGLRRCW